MGDKIQKGGYPDHGSGRYTIQAGYPAWMKFMKHQRVHYNFLETIMAMLCNICFAGIAYPRTAAIWGAIYFVARVAFTIGYLKSPRARMFGGIPV